MSRLPLGLAMALTCALTVPSLAQSFYTVGTGTVVNTTTSYPAPYGNYWWGSRHQFLITAAELNSLNVPPGTQFNSLGFDVTQVNGQALSAFTIGLAHTMTADLGAAWDPTPPVAFTTATYLATVGWNDHSLQTPFVWNGIDNILVETCHQNSSYTLNCIVNQSTTTFVSSRYYRADAAGICGNALLTGTASQRPNMRLADASNSTLWQTNRPGASLDINGVLAAPLSKAATTVCFGNPVAINIAGGPGAFEAVYNFAPTVPLGGGALPTSATQMINVDLAQPIVFLNGGVVPSFLPLPGPFALGFAAPGVPLTASIQMAVLDGSAPDGYSLSQAGELSVIASGTLPGPTTDDSGVLINFAAFPLCIPSGVNYYGTNYTQAHVISNGRIIFGALNTAFTPTTAQLLTDGPSLNLWCDLNPGAAGTITVSSPAPGDFRVDWTGVVYFLSTIPNTFGLQVDAAGNARADGLAGVALGGAGAQLLGISAGTLGATDPGATIFAPSMLTAGPFGLGMLYNLGTQGTVTAGLNAVDFVFNGVGYDWMAN